MEINNIVESVFHNGLSLETGIKLVLPVLFYVLGMVAYAVFIFKFYRFIASRDMFALDLSSYEQARYLWVRRFLHVVMYIAKYLIVFPAFAFFWFAVLTFILALLSKERAISEVLIIALATVAVIRVSAYYNEDLSRDVAKVLPFAVLGLFLIDASFFEVSKSLNVLKDADDYRESILYYMLFLVALEFTMRLLLGLITFFVKWKNTPMKTAVGDDGPASATVECPDWEKEKPKSETSSPEEGEQEQENEEQPAAPVSSQTSPPARAIQPPIRR